MPQQFTTGGPNGGTTTGFWSDNVTWSNVISGSTTTITKEDKVAAMGKYTALDGTG